MCAVFCLMRLINVAIDCSVNPDSMFTSLFSLARLKNRHSSQWMELAFWWEAIYWWTNMLISHIDDFYYVEPIERHFWGKISLSVCFPSLLRVSSEKDIDSILLRVSNCCVFVCLTRICFDGNFGVDLWRVEGATATKTHTNTRTPTFNSDWEGERDWPMAVIEHANQTSPIVTLIIRGHVFC